jgi:hypothetical protein
MIEIPWHPSRRELRQFAFLLAAFLLAAAGYAWWRQHSAAWAAAAAGAAVLSAAVGGMAPQVLRVVYVGWMCLAFPVAWVVSHLVLAVIFFGVITPIGLLVRLVRGDPLQRQFDRQAESYWVPHAPSDDPKRYFQQF